MNIQDKVLEEVDSTRYPTVKEESWRFTDLSRLNNHSFNGSWKNSNLTFDKFSEVYLVFENGKLLLEKSNIELLPSGVELKSINDYDGLKSDTLKSEKNGLINLNISNFSDGYYLKINKNIDVDIPIHIIYLTDSPNLLNCVRNYAEIGDNSSVTIIEEYIGEDTVIYLTNSITEIYGGKIVILIIINIKMKAILHFIFKQLKQL